MTEPAIRCGDSVTWRSSKRAWLGRQGGRFCLIAMIDEASGRVLARFAEENSTPANLDLLGVYVTRFGRPKRIRTHRLSLFRGNPRRAGGSAAGRSQIRRALAELEIEWSPTDPAATSGFASEFFKAAKRELGRGLRQARAKNLADANRYLERVYLPAWHDLHPAPPSQTDVHRRLGAGHNLEAILSEVEIRTVSEHETVQFYGASYKLRDAEESAHLRGAHVQVEKRRDGSVYLRTENGCLPLKQCDPRFRATPTEEKKKTIKKQTATPRGSRQFNRAWMRDFFKLPEPPLWRSLK